MTSEERSCHAPLTHHAPISVVMLVSDLCFLGDLRYCQIKIRLLGFTTLHDSRRYTISILSILSYMYLSQRTLRRGTPHAACSTKNGRTPPKPWAAVRACAVTLNTKLRSSM